MKKSIDLSIFSDEQLAGQRLMAGFDGTEFSTDLEYLIRTLKVGGIILFSRNVTTPSQVKQLCRTAQECAHAEGQPPLLIAVDQEGGQVARLRESFTQFPGNPAIQGLKDATRFGRITAEELRNTGFNMNMAPVMDVVPPMLAESVMAERVFPGGPDRVSKLGVTVIENLQKGNIMAVAKHFPGIGRTTLDSHIDLPALDTNLETLQRADLIPFAAAIAHDVTGIMLSHILYRGLDPDWPASLSVTIAKDLLRERMRFRGIVLTDDLDMGAIAKHYDIETVIGRILRADIDIALICRSSPKIKKAFDAMLKHLSTSEEFRQKTFKSIERVLKSKEKFIRNYCIS
jgi:beta-N-acetylhexosaminidase